MLTDSQIKQLFDFVRSKYVRYYDLQVELVDHLASAIEEKMNSDLHIGFDQALREVYTSFGIYGFGKVVMEKEAAVHRQSFRLWYREFFHWFRGRQWVFSCLIFATFWTLCLTAPLRFILYGFAFLSAAAACWYHFKHRRIGLQKDMRLLLLSPFKVAFFQIGYIGGFLPLYFYTVVIDRGVASSLWLQENSWVAALWMTGCSLCMISHLIVRRRVEKQAKEMYPAAFAG